MSKVYSYLRFSSKRQEYGDSKGRQASKAVEYCRKHGLTLETATFEDLGVSAWKNKNASEGALGAFLRAVDDGLIPSDSTLLVEHLDRVSRAKPLKAQELFISIINRGLTLVTLNDEIAYSEASINGDLSKLLVAVIKLAGANDENEKRSERTRAGLRRNLENGVKSKRCPTWLTTSDDRKSFIVIPERAAIVQRIFEMCVNGYGIYQIANTLNAEAVPNLAKPKMPGETVLWRGAQIARILHDRSVLGHQNARTAGVVRENYYVPIIEPKTFYEAQAAMERRNTVGKGRPTTGYLQNLLSGLLRCECGDTIRFLRNERRPHLRCDGAMNGSDCDAPWFAYKPVEDELLAWLLLDSDHLLIAEHERAEVDVRPELRKQIEQRKAQRQRLFDFVISGDMEGDEDAQRNLHTLRDQIASLEEQLRQAETAQAAAPEDAAEINNALYFEHYDAHIDGAPDEVVHDIRTRMREAIRRSVAKVVLMHGDWYEQEGAPMKRRFQVVFRKRPELAFDLFCRASTRQDALNT